MHRILLALACCLTLVACGTAEPKWATDEAVQAAAFVSDAPASVTLYTVINNRSGSGAHSGLVINGNQRVIFDPAGSWYHPRLPERNDMHYGLSDRMIAYYIDYHARETFRVVEQTRLVAPETAALIMRRAMDYGAVPKAQCANSITTILGGVPGFETISNTWFPNKLSEQFATLPGVTSRVITDDDDDNNHGVLMVQADGTPL